MIFPRYSNIGIFPGYFHDQHNWCLMFNVGPTEAMWLMVSPCFTQYYNIDDHGMVGKNRKTWRSNMIKPPSCDQTMAVKYWHGNGHFVYWINLSFPMMFRWSAQIVPLKMARLTSGISHPFIEADQIPSSCIQLIYHLRSGNDQHMFHESVEELDTRNLPPNWQLVPKPWNWSPMDSPKPLLI